MEAICEVVPKAKQLLASALYRERQRFRKLAGFAVMTTTVLRFWAGCAWPSSVPL